VSFSRKYVQKPVQRWLRSLFIDNGSFVMEFVSMYWHVVVTEYPKSNFPTSQPVGQFFVFLVWFKYLQVFNKEKDF